jgi:hypothetical protein
VIALGIGANTAIAISSSSQILGALGRDGANDRNGFPIGLDARDRGLQKFAPVFEGLEVIHLV